MEIRPVGADLFMQAERQTDGRNETTVACRSSANGPKNERYSMVWERVQ